MTDQEILTGLRQNDRKIMEYLYKTLAPPIFKHVLSNNGTKDDAKDVFQETFIKVLKNIQEDRYTDNNKFEAYFIQIARYTWTDHFRTNKTHFVGDDDFLLERADESDEDALMQLILHDNRLETLSTVWQSWEDTDCHQRLSAFHFEGQSTQKIADTEGIAQNTLLNPSF